MICSCETDCGKSNREAGLWVEWEEYFGGGVK